MDFQLVTLSMSAVIGLGPLDENDATTGANSSLLSILFSMIAIGLL